MKKVFAKLKKNFKLTKKEKRWIQKVELLI